MAGGIAPTLWCVRVGGTEMLSVRVRVAVIAAILVASPLSMGVAGPSSESSPAVAGCVAFRELSTQNQAHVYNNTCQLAQARHQRYYNGVRSLYGRQVGPGKASITVWDNNGTFIGNSDRTMMNGTWGAWWPNDKWR